MTVKKLEAQAYFKKFVKVIDGKPSFVLPEEEAAQFFKKFCEERDICDEANPHIEWLLNALFGLNMYTVDGEAFTLSKIQMLIMAKSKKQAKEKFEQMLKDIATVAPEDIRHVETDGKYTIKEATAKEVEVREEQY